jgi:transposase
MRVRKDHPLRAIRAMVDEILGHLSRHFDTMYARVGRPSIAPERLLRAQLLQMLYSIRSERLMMEEMDYNLLFRWFVGLNADDDVWDATVFTKNRDRLLEADVAKEFLARVVEQARAKGLTSDEHFTVDGSPSSVQRWTAPSCPERCKVRRVFATEDPNVVLYWMSIWDSLHFRVRSTTGLSLL